MVFLQAVSLYAAESNERFVRRSLESYFSESIRLVPGSMSQPVYVLYDAPPVDELNVSGAALSKELKSSGITRTSGKDSAARNGIGLQLSRLEFSYENRNGGVFSRGDIYRVLDVAGSVRLLETGSTIWEDYLIRRYEEKIDLAEIESLEDESSRLFGADIPPGPVQKIWEPVIVSSIVGGLVYLFFASR
jgi:hypothetical protein